MTPQFTQIGPFSGIKPISTGHLNQTLFSAAFPAAVLCSPVAGSSLTQPCNDKIDEGAILVLSDVLTSCMVGNHNSNNSNDDERFFQSHLFFSQSNKHMGERS